MLEKATDLCGAALGVMRTFDGEHLHTAASRGASAALVDFLRRPLKPVPGTILERFVRGDAVVESVLDITEHETLRTSTAPGLRALMKFAGARSYASVALRKDDALLGIISVYRQEVRPFTDKQIALLQNFAVQAVIAMENARLITETRETRDAAETALRNLQSAQASLVQSQKMSALGQLTSGIAYEINNPLTFINNF